MVIDQGSSSEWATLEFQPQFLSDDLNNFGLPVEVRNSELKVVGHSMAPGSLRVKAPGKYYVLARLPAGQEITEEVEVIPGQTQKVSLAFDEEGVAQPGVDEVSLYLGLPERTLLPTEVQSKSARRPPPIAAPSIAPPVAATTADPGEIAAKSGSLESLEVGYISVPAPPSYDPVDQLLAEYVSLTSAEPVLESAGVVVAPAPPAIIRTEVLPKRDLTPINLYLRLFRGNALGLKARALPADQWDSGFESGSKGRLTLSGTQEPSVLQVIQPGRPTLNIVLPISPAAGCKVVIRRCVVSSPVRDEVSFDVHMGNVKADSFLRYSAQGMLTEASQLLLQQPQQSVGPATQLLHDKFEDPVAAVVGAYGLLKFGNKERRNWITNLYHGFEWLPDAAAIEGESLAREGKTAESLRTFLKLAERGLPLFTDGVIFAVDRLELFAVVNRPDAPDEEIRRARSLLELLRNYCQFVDLSKQISRYTGRMPHLPSADPASVTPELEKDATVLSLTLEGGDEGVVRIKKRSKPAVRRPSIRSMEEESLFISENQTERSNAVANLIQANDPQSIALRVLHLASQSAETDLIPDSVDENSVLERIANVSPVLGIEFLELGKLAGRTVGRVNVKLEGGALYGTGFMVSPSLLLTTNRILPQPDIATKTTVDFDYELTAGALKPPHTFKLEPDRFFLTNPQLDFTLVHVADRSNDFVPLSDFGFNRLNGEFGKILCGESINLIHYPEAGPKSVLLRSGVLLDYVDDLLHYEAETSSGSLGAPIFNDQWEVIGLHHSAVPVGGKLTNEGIRISSILRACREAFLPNPAMQELLEQVVNPPDVVLTSISRRKPRRKSYCCGETSKTISPKKPPTSSRKK